MKNLYEQNPFEVLRIDPDASDEQVVALAARRRQRAADDHELTAIRQAVQALTGEAEKRLLARLFTHPRPGWERSDLVRWVGAFRRPPLREEPSQTMHPGELGELANLLRSVLGEGPDQLLARPGAWESPREGPMIRWLETCWKGLGATLGAFENAEKRASGASGRCS
jgi:hypothetical protein